MRERALADAYQTIDYSPVERAMRSIQGGPMSANPAAMRLASYIEETLGPGITPAKLYEARKVINDRLSGPHVIGDEMSAAVKGAEREALMMRDAIDEAINGASGGQWGRYLETYGRASRPVEAARGAQAAREVFSAEGVPELGGVPEVTQTRLTRALAAARGRGNFPRQLSAPGEETMSALSDQIGRANEVQKARKLAGTAGGGSQTSTDLALDTALHSLSGTIPGVRPVVEFLSQRGDRALKAEVVRLLQDPQAAAQAIRAAAASGRELSQAETLVLRALGGAGAGAPAALQAQQPVQ
jgi:hypothetical protein